MKDKLDKIFKKYDIEIYGISNTSYLKLAGEVLEKRIKDGKLTEFEIDDIDKRVNLKNYLNSPKSVIVIGIQYPLLGNTDGFNGKYYGWYSSASMGHDYHKLVREKLSAVKDELESEFGEFDYYMGVDTTPLIDRSLAYESGLGFYGKNSFLINPSKGSAFFIGYIISNIFIESTNEKNIGSCGNCRRCIDSCPTGAIGEDGMNPLLCISYITQKKDLSYEEMDIIGKRIYGCDVCQLVCPYNGENIRKLRYPENNYIELFEFLKISNNDFKKLYGSKSFSWRGRKILKRNAYVVLGNYQNPQLYDFLKSSISVESEYYHKYIYRGLLYSDEKRYIDDKELNSELKEETLNQIKDFKFSNLK